MNIKVISFLITLVVGTISPAPVYAQAVCGDRDEIVSRLEAAYQEKASAVGMAGNGGVVELYTSEKGSWTLLLTQPTGVSCLIAAGDNWETMPEPKPKAGTKVKEYAI